ncbi:MAG: FlgD immunoglobulin-like domain containing protein [Campylobacterales bacterium]
MVTDSLFSNPTAATNAGQQAENPKGKLDKEAFLKLFLEELKMQGPTAPMENEKILEQTSMLAQLESQQLLKDFVEDMSDTFNKNSKLSMQYNAVNMVGKSVETDQSSLEVDDIRDSKNFQLYFDEPIQNGQLEIRGEDGSLIQTMPLNNHIGQSGYVDFSWNLQNAAGEKVAPGAYSVSATYFNENQEKLETRMGRGKVESVLFEDGQAYLKLGGGYVPAASVTEFY